MRCRCIRLVSFLFCWFICCFSLLHCTATERLVAQTPTLNCHSQMLLLVSVLTTSVVGLLLSWMEALKARVRAVSNQEQVSNKSLLTWSYTQQSRTRINLAASEPDSAAKTVSHGTVLITSTQIHIDVRYLTALICIDVTIIPRY